LGQKKNDLAATVAVSATVTATLTSDRLYTDPTYRISKLEAAGKKPVSVAPDESLNTATTLMLTHDFSQLPVMLSDHVVKGIITWTSIGTRLALGKKGTCVREFMDNHQEIPANSSLFKAIPIIAQYQYVLIRGNENRITGIVTASDLSLQFQQLAEPFLLLGEIENHLRLIIGDKFTPAELADIRNPDDASRQVDTINDLNFGEYIRLLEKPNRWEKINLAVERKVFCEGLEQVRKIRNDVMHFNPDEMKKDDLQHLRDFTHFLQQLQSIGVL
jgi:CBS domain-containing protein